MAVTKEPHQAHSFPFEARNQDEIMSQLRAEGVEFRTFDCVNEGDYAPEDAAWNYMDIPHLTYVHKQVDGVLTLAADAITGSVFFQRIPFFRLPLTVLIYQTAKNTITYYTSFGFYLVVIQTTWEPIGVVQTRVTTRYAVGWTSWLAGLAYPLIKRLLVRNYGILMSEDLPMRNQRGELRKKGYDFRMSGAVPSFIESRKIMQQNVVTPEQNVIAPANAATWAPIDLHLDSMVIGSVRLIGDANHIGLAVCRTGNAVEFYPRLCPHEGASLDDAVKECISVNSPNQDSCTIHCPWHGRKFRPILSVKLPAASETYETSWHRYEVDGIHVLIACNTTDTDGLRNADWSQAAAKIGDASAASATRPHSL